MAIKTFDEIVESVMAYMQAIYPEANLTVGSFNRDALVDAPASELAELYGEVRIAQEAQSIRDATGEHLDRLLANWALYRRPGTVATGTVWFQRTTAPIADVLIPAGTSIKTSATISQDSVEFITTTSVTMLVASAAAYYNADENLYEIEATVEASVSGSEGNVGPNLLTMFTGTSEINSSTNRTATSGGADLETDAELRERGLSVIAGTNAGTKDGYEALVEGQSNVSEVIVVGPNDDDMERVKDGGGADVWIKTSTFTEQVDSYAYPAGELSHSLTGPVQSLSYVRENGVLLTPGVDFGLVSDPGVYGRSTYANDLIVWSTPRLGSATIEIAYEYCPLITTLQTLLDADSNHHVGADILAKLSYDATVNVTMSVEIFSGYDTASVTANVNIAISAYIEALSLGAQVQQSDIIALAEGIAGVDSVVLPLTTFEVVRELSDVTDGPDYVEGEATGATTGNLITRRFEYPVAGTIQINYYS